MKKVYVTGQMRSGTTLVSSFLGEQRGIRILVDQARVLTASGEAFKDKDVDFEEPLNLLDRLKLFQAYINVNLWLARNNPESGLEIALKRLAPFMGHISRIRSPKNKPYILKEDISSLPDFRNHVDFYQVVIEHSIPVLNRQNLVLAGNKETRGEELATKLVQQGHKSVVIIRDPRAVVSSLIEKIGSDKNFGVKSDIEDATDRWLKGYELCRSADRLHLIRYEDFILKHENTVSSLSEYLGVELEPGVGIKINNSSFADVSPGTLSTSGVNRWRNYRDQDLIASVTERCRKEILDLGYEL